MCMWSVSYHTPWTMSESCYVIFRLWNSGLTLSCQYIYGSFIVNTTFNEFQTLYFLKLQCTRCISQDFMMCTNVKVLDGLVQLLILTCFWVVSFKFCMYIIFFVSVSPWYLLTFSPYVFFWIYPTSLFSPITLYVQSSEFSFFSVFLYVFLYVFFFFLVFY